MHPNTGDVLSRFACCSHPPMVADCGEEHGERMRLRRDESGTATQDAVHRNAQKKAGREGSNGSEGRPW